MVEQVAFSICEKASTKGWETPLGPGFKSRRAHSHNLYCDNIIRFVQLIYRILRVDGKLDRTEITLRHYIPEREFVTWARLHRWDFLVLQEAALCINSNTCRWRLGYAQILDNKTYIEIVSLDQKWRLGELGYIYASGERQVWLCWDAVDLMQKIRAVLRSIWELVISASSRWNL